MSAEHKKIFIGPDEGASLPILDIVHKVTAQSFNGGLTIIEWGLPPSVMIPSHTHGREDVCSLVLEGELTCDVGGELGLHSPGGFESYYNEYEEIASKLASGEIDEEAHRKARAELDERYGLTWHDERIPEARARFGLGS